MCPSDYGVAAAIVVRAYVAACTTAQDAQGICESSDRT